MMSFVNADSSILKLFKQHQVALDERNDKYERLVKLSRDVTVCSKRLIFLLLRKGNLNVDEAEAKVSDIEKILWKIANELNGEDSYQFHRAFSPGIQEFIEAVTLLRYVKTKTLLSYAEAQNTYFYQCAGTYAVLCTPEDYLLGVADLTGELMRMAICAISSHEQERGLEICSLLQRIYAEFLLFKESRKDLSQKLNVMKASVKKVETACYAVHMRSSEIPDFMMADVASCTDRIIDGDLE